MKTTIAKIKTYHPCNNRWKKLISVHGIDPDKELTPIDILKSNGIKDAIWGLRTFEEKNKVYLFCADVAESVLHLFENKYPNDKRVRQAIEAIRLFVDGKIDRIELKKAADAAYDAAYAAYAAAAYADADAAYDAAYAAYADADAYADAYADYAAAAAYDAYDAARINKWNEIETLFIKHFGDENNNRTN